MNAKLAFFYGWTPQVIDELDYPTAFEYFNAIEVIEAQNAILGIRVSSYPHMKDDGRNKIMKELNRIAFPFGDDKPLMSTDDFFKVINGG